MKFFKLADWNDFIEKLNEDPSQILSIKPLRATLVPLDRYISIEACNARLKIGIFQHKGNHTKYRR